MMRLRDNCAMSRRTNARPSRHATTHLLERMVIIAEDSRFKTHHGVDFVELRDAWVAGGHRGASTIKQQLAKNLYLRSEEHTSELQSQSNLVCRLLLEKKNRST